MVHSTEVGRRGLLGVCAGLIVAAPAGVGALRNLVIRRREAVTITARGASLAGIRAAMREVGEYYGGTVRLAVPFVRIQAAEMVTGGPITLPETVTLEGEGAALSIHGNLVTPPLFLGRDVSTVRLRNIAAVGNSTGIADTQSGTFALFELSAASCDDMEDIALDNVSLSHFGGERWVQFLQRSPGRVMSGLEIVGLVAHSGASIAPAALGVSAAALWIHGAAGEIRDVAVRDLSVSAAGIKQGCVLFHKVRRASVAAAAIANAGRTGATDNAGAYAIMAYADPGEMSDIAIQSPVLRSPRSAGIYLRGVERVRVSDAQVSGQSDRVTANLPKGAIVLNGCSAVRIHGGRLTGNAFDLSVADGGVNALHLSVEGLQTEGSRTSVFLAISPGRGPITGVSFTDCTLSSSDRVLQVMNEQVAGRFYNDVRITGGRFRSATAANVIELTQGAITAATGYCIEDTTVQAGRVAIMATGLQGALTVRRTTIEGLAHMDYGIVADDCPHIELEAITFRGVSPRYAYAARSIRRRTGGTIRGLVLPKGGAAAAPGSLKSTF